ncbi:MAG: DUF3301 domain-containing protein [Pseudomonadota bacterium]
MIELIDIAVLGGILAILAYAFAATRVRELAIMAARRSTKTADVQLLDQTVALNRVSMSRDRKGSWRVWRQYRFEYSRDGVTREDGQIIMLGKELQAVVVADPPTLH